MKRTPLRRVSKKQRERYNEYTVLRQKFLHDNHWCEAGPIWLVHGKDTGCTRVATEVHHREGRGSKTNKVDSWTPICRACHTAIHNHPSRAREIGLLA